MALRAGIEVSGLRELRAELKKIDPKLQKQFRENLKAAGQTVIDDAKKKLQEDVSRPKVRPHRSTGAAADSLRVSAGGNSVYVVGGKAKVPYYGWLDFGGRLLPTGFYKNRTKGRTGTGFKYSIGVNAGQLGRGRRNMQNRPFKRKGRFLYPAIGEHSEDIIRAAQQAVDTAVETIDAEHNTWNK